MSFHDDEEEQGKKKDPKKGESGPSSPGFSDSGLGNLPPLSEFESSSGGIVSDGGFPPLNMTSDSGQPSFGGLPPISDIPVETPVPTGGNVRPSPPAFEDTPMFDTPMSDSGLGSSPGIKGTGFQDLAADSDFTPETPAIGPGPDSDLDTPMFDSAFGAGSTPRASTPDTGAPTQAMETPMFGARQKPPVSSGFGGDALGFDEDATFGVTTGADSGFGAGTPIPDLSPDTFAGTAPPATPTPAPPAKAKAKGGMPPVVWAAGLSIFCLIAGLVAAPYLADYLKFIPNPQLKKIAQLTEDVASRDKQIKDLTRPTGTGDQAPLTQEEINRLIKDRDTIQADITKLTADKTTLDADVAKLTEDQATLEGKIEALNQDFAESQQQYEDLLNQTAIVRARRDGLDSEVERLQALVGKLDEANNRSIATKDMLLASVQQLAAAVQESIPLTPAKYAYEERVARASALREKVAGAKWVEPGLLQEYTALYLSELNIAGAREYFFARIPVTDRYGSTWQKWAECVMNGNWSVYYRTLDGQNIGSYANTAPEKATPTYAFNESLPPVIQKQIEETVISSRTKGFEETVRLLAQKEEVTGSKKTPFQRAFDSL